LLLEAADEIGRLIQYNCPGFLQNKRQVWYRNNGRFNRIAWLNLSISILIAGIFRV
jgi:hypothetical protein